MNIASEIQFWYLLALVAIALVGAGLWWLSIRRAHGSTEKDAGLLWNEYGLPRPWGLEDLLAFLLIVFGGQVLLAWGIQTMLENAQQQLDDTSQKFQAAVMFAQACAMFSTTVLGLMYIAARYKKSYHEMGLDTSRMGKDIAIGFAAFAMVVPFVLAIQALLSSLVGYEHASLKMLEGKFDLFVTMTIWVSAGLVAPFVEEIMFRALLISWLDRFFATGNAVGESNRDTARFKTLIREPIASWLAIGISSTLFALMHLGQGAAPIPLFIFAIALGYIYRRTGSVIPCIVLHFLLNAFSLSQFTLSQMMV